MAVSDGSIARPKRWDNPFGADMTPRDVERLLRISPFNAMDASRFPKTLPLQDILLNDTRVVNFEAGDIVVREGDYGSSAFLILRGSVQVVLESLPAALLGRRGGSPKKSLLRTVVRALRRPKYPEVRHYGKTNFNASLGQRGTGESARVFLQDVPRILTAHGNVELSPGEFFGELAALSRTPRSATIIAGSNTALLEIRWQGLRDMMRRTPALKQHMDALYRQNSLLSHLRETPLLQAVSPEVLQTIAAETRFESYGDFEWQTQFRKIRQESAAERLEAEPLICVEGNVAPGLVLIRSGFARLSKQYGSGHRTLAYLGKGDAYGLEELVFAWQRGEPMPLQRSVRAVGYVDVLVIPVPIVERHILPHIPTHDLEALARDAESWREPPESTRHVPSTDKPRRPIETGLLEFLLDERLINGTQTMIVNRDRCTRCDDCVRACAATHDNNSRFNRDGPTFDKFVFANACMHCVDPVCMIGCPTGAISRDPNSGMVIINDLTCIGCSTCANSCPYHNIQMVEVRQPDGAFLLDETQQPIVKATKCDLCSDHWGGPACQRACPHDALIRMDMRNLDVLSRWLHQ